MGKDSDMKVLIKHIPEGVHHNDTEVLLDTTTDELLIRPANFHTNSWEVRVPAQEIEAGITAARVKAGLR